MPTDQSSGEPTIRILILFSRRASRTSVELTKPGKRSEKWKNCGLDLRSRAGGGSSSVALKTTNAFSTVFVRPACRRSEARVRRHRKNGRMTFSQPLPAGGHVRCWHFCDIPRGVEDGCFQA